MVDMVMDMVTVMDMEKMKRNNRKIIASFASLTLMVLFGCSSETIVTLDNATEVALDEADISETAVQNLEAQEKDGQYNIQFDSSRGHYTFIIGKNGIIEDRKFETLEKTKAEENKASQSTSNPTQNTFSHHIISKDEAIHNALLNAGLEQSDVSDITCSLNPAETEYTVTFDFSSTTNRVLIDAVSGKVLSSVIE